MDAFDVSLGGTYHETILRGVMAPLLESESEGDSDSPVRRLQKDSTIYSIIPYELASIVCWGSYFLVDAFDISLGGTCHETFS